MPAIFSVCACAGRIHIYTPELVLAQEGGFPCLRLCRAYTNKGDMIMAVEELIRTGGTLYNRYIDDWKKDGGKVIGYTCSYAPEEILIAAGLLPVRLNATGSTETNKADVYMPKFHCLFSKHLLDQGLSKAFDFMDGVVFVNTCDQLRRMYDVWIKLIKFSYQTIMVVPYSYDKEDFEWYLENEVKKLRDDLEKAYDVKITDKALADAINVCNETRDLQTKLYGFRGRTEPMINGADTHKIILAGTSMPKKKYNELLKESLDELEKRDPITDYRARILIGGSVIDQPELIRVIEDAGGLVVTDVLCTGTRWTMDKVEVNGDPLYAIAKRYYDHQPCPRMTFVYERKRDFVLDMAKKYDVDGAIFSKIAFCDHHSGDNPLYKEDLEDIGVPALLLDRDYRITDIGRFTTRIEAFFEKLGK